MKEKLDALFAEVAVQAAANHRKVTTVRAVQNLYSFNVVLLQNRRREVAELCRQLPATFRSATGETFTRMHLLANGERWGGQLDAERLLALALATKHADFTLEREFWPFLAGGMPYVVLQNLEG